LLNTPGFATNMTQLFRIPDPKLYGILGEEAAVKHVA
jgi:hypothetical protein